MPVLFRFNYDAMPSLKLLNCHIIVFLLLIQYFTLWAVTLIFDLYNEHLQCSLLPVTWWNSVPNLNAIEQSAAELLQFQYMYLTQRPWTCITCCARLWDNFHQVWHSTTYPCLNYCVFMLISYVTLWPWSLTFDLELSQHFGCHAFKLYKIWAKLNNPWLSYWRFSTFSPWNFRGVTTDRKFSGVRGPNFTKLGEDIGRSLLRCTFVLVWIPCCIFKRGRLKFEWCWKRRQILHFLTPL